MNRFIIILFFIIGFLSKTYACLNGETKLLKDGTFLYQEQEGHVPYGHIFNSDKEYLKDVQRLDSLYTSTKDVDYLSDKGLLLILLKRYDEAINLYLLIEQIQPNRYSTASNIGTAYELKGQNEKALKWITKAVEIDPASHDNSEWIHIKILEVKIKGDQFCNTQFLLNTDFGTEHSPKSSLKKSELEELYNALYYQLNERVSFVKPKEKIVAQLLFDLGNVSFLQGYFGEARIDYNLAKKYGMSGQLIENRIKETVRLSNLPHPASGKLVENNVKRNYFLFGAIGIVVLLTILIIVFKRKRK